MFSLAGFQNVRVIHDEDADILPVRKEDWFEPSLDEPSPAQWPSVNDVQIQFFLENCKLTRLGE